MNYHLHRQGSDALILSAEELVRRRRAGELSGAEFIWREGMAQWEPLDTVLTRDGLIVVSDVPPISPAKSSSKTPKTALIVSAVIIAVLVFTVGGAVLFRLAGRASGLHRELAGDLREGEIGGRDDALTAASKPVQWTTNTLTAADVVTRHRNFRLQQYLHGYEKNGSRTPACDARAIGLITNWINQNYGGSVNTNLPSLDELSDSLANDPACNDPLILTITAVNAVELHEAIRRLERAVAGYRQSRHGPYPKFYATVTLSDKLIQDKVDRQPVLDAESLQHLKEFLQAGVPSEQQEELAEILLDGWGANFFYRNGDAVCEAVASAGKSCEWLALVLQGQIEVNKAWKARGGGYANSVSAAGWQGFAEHLAKATEHLSAAWKLRPESPQAANIMVYVSLGNSDIAEMRVWFDRATTAQIDARPAWNHLRWGLRPRWYGDPRSMLALGVTALNTRRFDTDVPRIFFDSITDVEAELELPLGEHIFSRKDIWPHLQEMYEGYIAATPEDQNKSGWRSTYAVVAYLAGHMDVSREQLEALQWKPHQWNLSGWGRDLSLMPAEVAARTGALAKDIEAAESALENKDVAKALQRYVALAEAKNADELTRSFISNRLATLKMRSAFERGEWVDLLPADAGFTGWRRVYGECKRLPDGSLEVQADKNGHMLYSLMPVERAFEVKGSFTASASSTKAFQAGLVMGLPDWDTASWYSFRIKRNNDEGDVSSLADGWGKRHQRLSPVSLNATTNSFSLRLQGDKVSATVNGVEMFKGVELPKNKSVPTNEFYLGLGAFNDMNTTVIRYHDVQVRKLPAR